MVKRTTAIIGVLLAAPFLVFPQERGPRESYSSGPPLAKTEAERKILAVLDEMVKSHQTYLNVPMADGKALWLLAEAADAKRIAEIGTSTGYSGLWFCLALEGTGRHLTTFEINHSRALLASPTLSTGRGRKARNRCRRKRARNDCKAERADRRGLH
jgi:predicted O-methyltransferase YrrM